MQRRTDSILGQKFVSPVGQVAILASEKNGQTLYVFGISFCEKFESFIVGGYLENKKGEGRFVAIQWRQPVNTIGLLADAIVSDYVPDAVRMKKETPLYRLFTLAMTA